MEKIFQLKKKKSSPIQLFSVKHGAKNEANQNGKSKQVIKSILKEVLNNSLAQAILNIILTPHLILKLILLVFVFGTTGLASYLVIQSIFSYLSFATSTTSRIIFQTPATFPQVTFCNVNWATTEYAYNNYKDLEFENEEEEAKRYDHDLNDILIECSFNGVLCDSNDFVWSFDDEDYGNCYTFNSGVDSNGYETALKQSKLAGPKYGLSLLIYTNVYEKLIDKILIKSLGIIVRLGNSSYSMHYSNGGILASSGFQTNIVVEREYKSMLPKPFSECEIDPNSATFIEGADLYNLIGQSKYAYSQQLCFTQCYQKYFINKYNCTFENLLSLYNNSFCNSNVTSFIYDWDYILDSDYIHSKCLPLCPLECNQTHFKTSLSFNQLIENSYYISLIKNNSNLRSDFIKRSIDGKTARDSFVLVNIFYDNLSYTQTSEIPQIDLISLLAYIGGNLGLFLGLSVFSFCEIIQAFVEIYFALKNDKKLSA
jgi:hypothetical protein